MGVVGGDVFNSEPQCVRGDNLHLVLPVLVWKKLMVIGRCRDLAVNI